MNETNDKSLPMAEKNSEDFTGLLVQVYQHICQSKQSTLPKLAALHSLFLL